MIRRPSLAEIVRHPVMSASALRALAVAVGVAASVVVSRLGGADVKGVSSAYAASNALVFLVVNLDSAQQILKDGRSRHDLGSVPRRVALLWPWFGLAAGVASLVGYAAGGHVAWLAIGAFAYLVSAHAGMISNALAGPAVTAWGALIQQAAMVVGAFTAEGLSGLDADTVRVVVLVSYAAPMPLFITALVKRTPHDETADARRPHHRRQILAAGLTWQPARLFQFTMLRADTLFVFALMGPAAAGIYSVGLSTASLAGLIPAQFAAMTTHEATTKRRTSAKRNALRAMVTGVFANLGLAAIGYPLITVAYGRSFSEAYWVSLAAGIGVTAYGVLQVLTAHMRVTAGPGVITVCSGAGALTMASLLLILVPHFGLIGAAMASSAGPVAAMLVAALLLRSSVGMGSSRKQLPENAREINSAVSYD